MSKLSAPKILLATLSLLAAGACDGPVQGGADEGAPGPDSALQLGKADGAITTSTTTTPRPSTRPGMGPTLYSGGVTFRVWAPNAERVFVVGDFNGWNEASGELAREAGNGNFSRDITGARAGQAYQYVILHAGQRSTHADPRAPRMTASNGKSVIVDPNAYVWKTQGYKTPGFDEMVIYELHIGTFNDTPGGAPGTWKSAAAKLDSLKDLGVNALEVMPPAEFAGDFSWGYNAAYPFAPEAAYGTPDDVKAFIDAAHARGMAVLIDVVHNHWGPSDLSAWCFDGECYGAGGIYFYTDWRLESGWGPRPDFGRREVRDLIADNARMWLAEYRADGLRWDSTVNIRSAGGQDIEEGWQVLQRVNDELDRDQPWKLMIAEDLQNNEWITKSTGEGGAGFDSQWDAGFFHPIDDAIIAPSDAQRDMWSVKGAIEHGYNGSATTRVIYTESHDEVANGKQRIPEMIYPGHADSYWSKKRSTAGAAIALTAPGIPMLFQGQELLEDGFFADSDPVDWSKATRFAGIRSLYRDLIRLRRNLDGVSQGLRGRSVNVFHVNNSDKVIAYHRWDRGGPGDDVVVVVNLSSRAFADYRLGLPRGGHWRVRFNSDWSGYSSDFPNTPSNDLDAAASPKDGLGFQGSIGIGAYSVVVLSQ